jgi:hypothetical protein
MSNKDDPPNRELTATQALAMIISKRAGNAVVLADDVAQAIDLCASEFVERRELWQAFKELVDATQDGNLPAVKRDLH